MKATFYQEGTKFIYKVDGQKVRTSQRQTPYEYVDFQYNVETVEGQEAKIPSFFVGEQMNRLSQSGRYVYLMVQKLLYQLLP